VLKVFDYSLNQLGDSGELACAKAIANCFKTNKTLQHIDISFNNFGKEATEIISEGI
jgi:Ran GTPase-activating protein (RanGAP) involved in mRNA processing and transport